MTYEEKQRRQRRNIEIFEDTQSRFAADAGLARAIGETVRRRKLILEGDPLPGTLPPQREKRAEVIVSGRRSFEAARRYAGRKVCVLNFASATGPGGGVRHGSSAQEESLCRCSTLYPALADEAMWNAFYAPHREARSRFGNDDIIYCPGVVVFKSDDDFPEMLPGKDWYKVDVLTCAAPNLRKFEEYEPETARAFIRGGELEKLLEKRIRRIFGVAAREGAGVLILGAFGCGAFRNPPELVASVFRRAVEEYVRYFETIEFAVFHMDHETPNHRAFCRAFADLTEAQAAHAEPITGAPASGTGSAGGDRGMGPEAAEDVTGPCAAGNAATEIRTRLLGEPRMASPIPADVAGTGGRVELDLGSGTLSSSGERGRYSFELAGARDRIFFDPSRSRCAIVTCGGLCPGINDVIQSIVLSAFHSYGIPSVIGIRYGLKGFIPSQGLDPVELTPENVQHIHELGGTILGTSRGPRPAGEVLDALLEKGVDMLFMIGGDGTMKAALDIHREALRRQVPVAVVGIPKTIDNDINFVPQSFGFGTAVEKASEAIRCAAVEARSVMGGVGLVRLMGRESGFIAASSALSAREADFVLIPEAPFSIDGESGLLATLQSKLRRQRHAVIVLAEGAGQYLLEETHRTDVSGNRQLADISAFLLERFRDYFGRKGMAYYPKFFDPGYLIRATPANAGDRQYCGNLGQNAVHAAMSGRTGMVVARIMDCYVHLPLELVTAKRRTLSTRSTLWRSVLEMTGQGDLGGMPVR